MTAIRWVIIRDRSPFDVGEDLGIVTAPDKPSAEAQGRTLYGGRVVARSALSREAEKFEPKPRVAPRPVAPKKHYGHGKGWPKGVKRGPNRSTRNAMGGGDES